MKVGELAELGNGETLVGFEGVLQIKRSDYGMTYGAGALGDDVRLTIAIEAMRK